MLVSLTKFTQHQKLYFCVTALDPRRVLTDTLFALLTAYGNYRKTVINHFWLGLR